MPRPLDHPLHPGGERPLRQVPERQVLSRLRETGGVHERTRAHTVAEAYDDVVLGEDLKQVVILGVERVFVTRRRHHRHMKCPAPADDAHHPRIGLERCKSVKVCAAVERQEVNALPAVLTYHREEQVGIDIGRAPGPPDGLVDRDRADGGVKSEDLLPDPGEVAPGREIHQRVRPLAEGGLRLLDLEILVAPDTRRPDIHVDPHPAPLADGEEPMRSHRVCGDDDPAPGDSSCSMVRGKPFLPGDRLNLGRDPAHACRDQGMHKRHLSGGHISLHASPVDRGQRDIC